MMYRLKNYQYLMFRLLTLVAVSWCNQVFADDQRIDYLSFSQGAIPVASGGATQTLRIGTDLILRTIDGDAQGFSLTPKPGAEDTTVSFVYQLPALTTFSDFSVPNVLETPSPSQTFFRTVEIAGSDQGPEGPFQELASVNLKVHIKKDQLTEFPATTQVAVRWVRLTLSGGIDVQRNKTFFDFSEIIGYGRQQPVPLLQSFSGKWKGRGVLLELRQDGVSVSGCYDREGDLTGTVDGNLLHATGKSRTAGIPSTFVLTVTDNAAISGVRSTNGAPFYFYNGNPAPGLRTECSEKKVTPLGCGSVIHGIHFGFNSADILSESKELVDTLSAGLKGAAATAITVIGHTSSEGSDAYNEELSQRRAEAVVTALIDRGVDASKISAKGHGEKEPIADNATGAGRSLNRRVEMLCR